MGDDDSFGSGSGDSSFGDSTFGDTSFGESSFGDSGFGDSSFGGSSSSADSLFGDSTQPDTSAGSFETYPFEPGGSDSALRAGQLAGDDPASPLTHLPSSGIGAPRVYSGSSSKSSGGAVLGAIGAGVAILMFIGVASTMGPRVPNGFNEYPGFPAGQIPYREEPERYTSNNNNDATLTSPSGSLTLPDGSTIEAEFPIDWEVNSADDMLAATFESGRLAAKIVEGVDAKPSVLARLAKELRAGFKASGKADVQDESTSTQKVGVQRLKGTFNGKPATETVTLIANREQDDPVLVVSWVTIDKDKNAAQVCRSVVRSLQSQFEDAV